MVKWLSPGMSLGIASQQPGPAGTSTGSGHNPTAERKATFPAGSSRKHQHPWGPWQGACLPVPVPCLTSVLWLSRAY